MKKWNKLKSISMAVIAAMLAACSGSSSSDEPQPIPAPTLTVTAGEATTHSVSVTFAPQNADRCAYLCIAKGETEPTGNAILAQGIQADAKNGSTVTIGGLKAATTYVVLAAVENGAGMATRKVEITTKAEETTAKSHTLVFYFMGNDTGLTGDMDRNLQKVKSTAIAKQLIDGNNNIAIFYDRGDFTRLTKIARDADGRTKEITMQEYNINTSCLTPEFISSVMGKVRQELPADSYGLVLSSHGGGWVPANVYDQHIAPTRFIGQDGDDWLEIPQLVEGLKGMHFDYILMDACFMASVECLYDLRATADYIVASPAKTLAAGFPYDTILPLLFTSDHSLTDVCKAFMTYYKASSGTISLTDCSKLAALAAAMRQVNAIAGSKQADPSTIQGFEEFIPHLYFDLEQYVEQLTGGTGSTFDTFKQALKATVLYEDHTDTFTDGTATGTFPITRCCGLTCHVNDARRPATHAAFLQTEWAKAVESK